MKIAAGMFYHEANSFNPDLVQKEDFVYCEGEEVIKRLYASEVFQRENAEIVPLIYAATLPNGIVDKDAYTYYADRILSILSENKDVDGVFLHLHGSMEVNELGSGIPPGKERGDLLETTLSSGCALTPTQYRSQASRTG